ncbi:unnamed protein product [Thelazia callipaeda]|uniref:Clc-like protein n=1 Tax=Thelazia callipaeda TaxID=103827 RepID=A0A0N5D4E9_THECL|nr:unnamed protein product [Thelazia callipaeda]
MDPDDEGPSKCSRKTALSLFLFLELTAYLFSCIALISPSWQYVYLENGRTEHHHGLWLDCKRDYSHDYGRSREYYETLYRLDKQQSPFDQFFLTSLLCVYKFDYYIDAEDLYDHNHDENRLQDDAYQHLFLGWKIASLAALGFAVLTAGAALLLSICAFCHRTLICAAAVLVTVSALLSSVGLLIFYIWASYQDNSILKEDDGIYQQYFGWGFYVQIGGTTIYFLASFVGCAVTSVAFKKNGPKLVKIEVVNGDNSTLLDRTFLPEFKRSFSAVYKLDSGALQKWEKDYLNMMQKHNTIQKSWCSSKDCKITKPISSSLKSIDQCNLDTAVEAFISFPEICLPHLNTVPKSILKTSSQQSTKFKSQENKHLIDDPNLTYEYLPSADKLQSTGTISKSFATEFMNNSLTHQIKDSSSLRAHSKTSINVYDEVYEYIPNKDSFDESKFCGQGKIIEEM